jgi:ribosomal protein S18 acetylase RimI-like enzyme
MFIRKAETKDLPTITALERIVEDPRLCASFEVLHDRLRLYPEGFFVAVFQDRVVGYLESIRWDGPSFERFEEISDFAHMHRRSGSILYIVFLAVDPVYRRYGAAFQLLEAAEKMAVSQRMNKIQLVALPKLVRVYKTMGFRDIRTLPRYLESTTGELMEKELKANAGH